MSGARDDRPHLQRAGRAPEFPTDRSNDDLTQIEISGSIFWSAPDGAIACSWRGPRDDVRDIRWRPSSFSSAQPLRLGAYDVGELRGDHYGVLTGGYLRGVGRLPDFLGGPIFVGGWLENGSAFDDLDSAKLEHQRQPGRDRRHALGPVLARRQLRFRRRVAVLHRHRTVVLNIRVDSGTRRA